MDFWAHFRREGLAQPASDYWDIQLPGALDTAAAYSPALFAYHASLVLLNATPLFSRLTIGELLDPSTHAPRAAVERHHLFPNKYLVKQGLQTRLRNQIANYALVEWPDNVAIGDRPPAEYFPPLFEELSADEQRKARFWHALPNRWEEMDYFEFLEARRNLIADVVKAAFTKLRTGDIPADQLSEEGVGAPAPPQWSMADLVKEEEDDLVEFKSSAFFSYKPDVPEKVVTEGVVKTVAGFLNAEGGTLVIGVSDDHEVLGIAADLDHKGIDVDRYVNALTSLLVTSLGSSAASRARIRVNKLQEEFLCVITVGVSPEPVYARVMKGSQTFFARINNTTRVLEGADLVSYIRAKWG